MSEAEFKPPNKTPWFSVVTLFMLSGLLFWISTLIPGPVEEAKPTIYQPRDKIGRRAFSSPKVEPQDPRSPYEVEKKPGW